jgi:hypothetical protein
MTAIQRKLRASNQMQALRCAESPGEGQACSSSGTTLSDRVRRYGSRRSP